MSILNFLFPQAQPAPDVFTTQALPLVLVFEGGYVNDPVDKGKATNHGITQSAFDSHMDFDGMPHKDVKDITMNEVTTIYKEYWSNARCGEMPPLVATCVFDSCVNNGQGRAVRILQQTVGAVVDGKIGSETLSKLKNADDRYTAARVLDTRISFYNGIIRDDASQVRFLAGWIRRVKYIKDYVNGVKTIDQIRQSW